MCVCVLYVHLCVCVCVCVSGLKRYTYAITHNNVHTFEYSTVYNTYSVTVVICLLNVPVSKD